MKFILISRVFIILFAIFVISRVLLLLFSLNFQIEFASPGSEISTVPHPNSMEHPSTLLTNNSRGFSSISSPNFTNPSSTTDQTSTSNNSRSLRILGKSSSATETTPLGTIPEQSYGELPFPGQQLQQQVRADVHSASRPPPGGHHAQGQQPVHGQLAHGLMQPHQYQQHGQGFQIPIFNNKRDHDLYWQRSTYRNADAMFPNYALNYPAPIHLNTMYQGNISPSIQYPETVMPKYREEAMMYQLSSAAAAAVHQPSTLQPGGTHAGIPHAQQLQTPLQPTTHAGNSHAQQLHPPQLSVPLATSSPPIGRQATGQPAGGGHGGQLGPQNDIGLPFKTSTRTSLHDYENMRYPVRRRRSQHSSNAASSTASSRPPSDEFGRLNRESSVIDGELLKRPATVASRSSGEAPDAVSLVSEVLDAEVTALTNSSPGSSNGSTERKSSSSSAKKAKLQDALLQQARKNLSEELSANQELRKIHTTISTNTTSGHQTTTTSTTSSSGIASKNSSQSNPNQTTLSSLSTGSSSLEASSTAQPPSSVPPLLPVNTTSGLPLLSIDTSGSKAAAALAAAGLPPIPESTHTYVYYDNLPFYENWPPPKQFPPPVRPRLSLQQQQHAYLGYQFVPPPEAASAQLIPPLTPHQSQGQVARPQQHPAVALSALGMPGSHHYLHGRPPSSSADRTDRKNDSPGVADTSLDTPPSHAGGGAQGSRPGSAHSAPLLDLSIDRHYEFDAARTPTDDIGKEFMIMP